MRVIHDQQGRLMKKVVDTLIYRYSCCYIIRYQTRIFQFFTSHTLLRAWHAPHACRLQFHCSSSSWISSSNTLRLLYFTGYINNPSSELFTAAVFDNTAALIQNCKQTRTSQFARRGCEKWMVAHRPIRMERVWMCRKPAEPQELLKSRSL